MSWNSTVTCSWCYERNHNKNGCEERKKHIAENPDGYEARRDRERLQKARTRQCSYCKKTGHNRKTCAQLRKDRRTLATRIANNRKDIAEILAERGLGIGSLVSFQRDYWNDNVYVGLVESVIWNAADNRDSVALVIRLNQGNREQRAFQLDLAQETTHDGLKVLSPVAESCVRSIFPKTWLNGAEYDEEKYIPKGDARPYYLFGEVW